MKLFKPSWVSHDGQPIFSIDIHPDGSRFATGGLGDGGSSGKVYIWNMTPVMNPKDESDENIPKVLCVMDNHLACVNSVRWSCNGRYLASGGDDRLIMIWQFAGYGGVGVFGGAPGLEGTTGERWRCTHTLKGHTGDVLDLAWSPGNQWLASCSIDNTVVIWNVETFPEITSVLKGHTSLVKGVTWDPIGSYLASQSDDKTVKIWKTLDWKLEMTISEPFVECTATTHVLRLSWSPDGGYLVSAHAMNNSGPTAQIIQREGWKTDMDFVGHRKAITCTRFNGCVFSNFDDGDAKAASRESKNSSSSLPYTCCAVGSRDRSLSVWLTSLRRPLVVVHDLFEDSVMDVSWSFDGFHLLCCSWDGTVAYVEFKESEIGKTLTQEEKNKLHKDTYGKTSCIVQQPLIIENPAMLAIQQKKTGAATTTQNGVEGKPFAMPSNYPTKQIETRTASGKRRIIPIFVAPQEALGGIPRPFGSNTGFGRPPSSSNLLKLSEKESPTKSVAEPKKQSAPDVTSTDTRASQKSSSSEKEPTKQAPDAGDTETPARTGEVADQKKKAVLDSRLCEKSAETVTSDAVRSVQFAATPSSAKTPDEKAPQDARAPAAPSSKAPTTPAISPRRPGRPPLPLKRKMNGPTSPRKKGYKHVRKDQTKSVTVTRDRSTVHEKQQTVEEVEQAHQAGPRTQIGQSRPTLSPKKLARRIAAQDSSTPPLVVTIDNELTSDEKPAPLSMHKVTCAFNKQERWRTMLSSPGIAVHVSLQIVGIACYDRSLHIVSTTSGRKLFPPLCSASPIVQVLCKGHHLMAVDANCQLSVWNFKSCVSVVTDCSFGHLMTSARNGETPTLKRCLVNDHGIPVLSLSTGKTFSYCVDLNTWVLVRSVHDAVEQFAENVAVALDDDHVTSNDDDIVLSTRMTDGMGAHAARSFHASPTSQRNATLASLESKLAACLVLQSVSEYRKWLLAYVRYLVQENLEVRLREICSDLIGPSSRRPWVKSGHTELGSWKPHILGLCKESLLQDEVLPVIGSNLAFQRLYTEFQDLLESKRSRPRFALMDGDP